MNPGSDESSVAENVTVQQPEGTSTGSVTSGDPIDQIFDRFKYYIDTKLGAFKNTFSPQDDSPTKKLRREVEAEKLKFKGNEQQFLFNAEVEDYSFSALDSIKRNDSSQAQKFLETSLDLIRKRQKLIKLADKSDAGWLVVQEYEQEELTDDSEDEKRNKKRNRRLTERNGRWQAPPRSPVSILRALLLLLLAVMTIDSFFEVACPFALSLLFSRACFTRNKLPNLYSLLLSFASVYSCGVRIRRKICFIRTNLVRENENEFSFI